MSEIVKNVRVTIPELDIERKHADKVKMAPKRFSIWWDWNERYEDEDCSVPNEMIIIEDI